MRSKQQAPQKLHKRYRRYTQDTLQKAYEAARSGMSVRKAAKTFGIPATTIRDRLTGIVNHGNLKNRDTLLTQEEEVSLLEYMEAAAYLGYPYSSGRVKEIGGQLANALRKKANAKPLSNSWMTWFAKRWEERIGSIKSVSLTSSEDESIHHEQVVQCIGNLKKLTEKTKGKTPVKDRGDIKLTGKWLEMRIEQLVELGQVPVSELRKKIQKNRNTAKQPSPGGVEAIKIDSSDDESAYDDGVDDDSSVGDSSFDESDFCCVCNKFTPPDLDSRPYVKLVKWAYCDKCSHCVHLSFCHEKKTVRKSDTFLCQHCV